MFNSSLDLQFCSAVGWVFSSLCAPLPLFSQSSPSFLNCPYQNWVVLLTSPAWPSVASPSRCPGLAREVRAARSELTPHGCDHSSFGTSSLHGAPEEVSVFIHVPCTLLTSGNVLHPSYGGHAGPHIPERLCAAVFTAHTRTHRFLRSRFMSPSLLTALVLLQRNLQQALQNSPNQSL